MTRYPADPASEGMTQQLNMGFYFFFLGELVLHVLGRGFVNYFHDRFHWFDFLVIFVSSFDIFLYYSEGKQLDMTDL